MHLTKSCADSRLKADGPSGGDGGTVTGYASTWTDVPDCYGDVVAKGAFAKTLERWSALNAEGRYIPLLYGHNTDDPKHNIGRVVAAEEDDRGLLVTAELDADNDLAQYARKLVADGRLYQFSFAFDILDEGLAELPDGSKARELRSVELYEVSLVQIPANQDATVQGVKCSGCHGGSEAKQGRRNSKADLDDLMACVALRDEAADALSEALADGGDWAEQAAEALAALDKQSEILAALIGADGPDGTTAEGEGGDEPPEGPDAQGDGGLAKAKLTAIKSALSALA